MFTILFQLVCEWRMTRGIQEQTKAFLDGFNEVVPLEWLQVNCNCKIQLKVRSSCTILAFTRDKNY